MKITGRQKDHNLLGDMHDVRSKHTKMGYKIKRRDKTDFHTIYQFCSKNI